MALSGTMAASVAVAEKNMPIALVITIEVGLGRCDYKWNRCIIHWISAVYYDVKNRRLQEELFYKRNSDLGLSEV